MVKDKSTEQRIFNAARKVFLQKGLAGARMQEIADEAGINKALLHYYFRSKEHLFQGIFQEVFEQISKGFGDILNADMDVMGKTKFLIEMYVDNLCANRYLPVFVLSEMNQHPERLEGLITQGIVNYFAPFFIQMEKEAEEGKIRKVNPMHFMLNLLGMVIFPFAAYPLLSLVTKNTFGRDLNEILMERKKEVYDFVENALTPNSKA